MGVVIVVMVCNGVVVYSCSTDLYLYTFLVVVFTFVASFVCFESSLRSLLLLYKALLSL